MPAAPHVNNRHPCDRNFHVRRFRRFVERETNDWAIYQNFLQRRYHFSAASIFSQAKSNSLSTAVNVTHIHLTARINMSSILSLRLASKVAQALPKSAAQVMSSDHTVPSNSHWNFDIKMEKLPTMCPHQLGKKDCLPLTGSV